MCMLACIHPGGTHAGETHAVLEYAKTTASIVRKVTRAEVKDIRSDLEKELGLLPDPMADDHYDSDDEFCRRTERIECVQLPRSRPCVAKAHVVESELTRIPKAGSPFAVTGRDRTEHSMHDALVTRTTLWFCTSTAPTRTPARSTSTAL